MLIFLTGLSNLCEWQGVWHDVWENGAVVGVGEVGQTEQQQAEDDEEEVEGDESDQDLTEDGFQVHVLAVQHSDG